MCSVHDLTQIEVQFIFTLCNIPGRAFTANEHDNLCTCALLSVLGRMACLCMLWQIKKMGGVAGGCACCKSDVLA